MRHLRDYEHVADKEHYCDSCCRYIEPGDFYKGGVWVDKDKGIVVFRRHVFPGCDPDLDDHLTDGLDETIPQDNTLEETLNIAA